MKKSKLEFNAKDSQANGHPEFDTPPSVSTSSENSSEDSFVYGSESSDEEPGFIRKSLSKFFNTPAKSKEINTAYEFSQIHGMK